MILAEVGVDMTRFPSTAHLALWAGMCPGNHESAGKGKTGTLRSLPDGPDIPLARAAKEVVLQG